MKPHSPPCERNKEPILDVLRDIFADAKQVLEIGSGTGQHAVWFGRHLPHLVWQTSDLEDNHAGINLWLADEGSDNIKAPIVLDVDQTWSQIEADAIFTANTLHIISWPQVERLFEGAAGVLQSGGVMATYGPFNYNGEFTSPSNARFELWLKDRDPLSGIRDFEAIQDLATRVGFELQDDREMPANNRMLIWKRL